MQLMLDRGDLKPKYKQRILSTVDFENFTEKAQKAITVVGKGVIYEFGRISFYVVYPKKL